MAVPPEQIREWDLVAQELGPTPIYDDHGQIVPIGEHVKGGRIYVIWNGRAIGIFYNWGLCGALVSAFPGSLFQGFKTLKDAKQAWLDGPAWGSLAGKWTPPPIPRPARPTPGHQPTLADATPPPSPTSNTHAVSEPPVNDFKGSSGATASPLSCKEFYDALPAPDETKPRRTPHERHEARPAPVETKPRRTPHERHEARPAPDETKPRRTPHERNDAPPAPIETTPRRARPAAIVVGSKVSAQPTQLKPDVIVRAERTSRAAASPAGTVSSLASTATSTVIVPEGRAYVVVRGDNPGVYTDKHTAAIMMGNAPGIKLSAFRSRRRAERFYEEEVAAGRVGAPVMENK